MTVIIVKIYEFFYRCVFFGNYHIYRLDCIAGTGIYRKGVQEEAV